MPAAAPVALRDHAREVRRDRGGDGSSQQRDDHADEAVAVDQRGDAARGQHGGHRLVDKQAAGGDHGAEQHGPVLVRDFARGVGHAMPAKAELIAVCFHHPGHGCGMNQRTGQGGVDHEPRCRSELPSVSAGENGNSGNDHRRKRRPGKAVKGVEHGGAVGGDAGDEDDGQQAVEEANGEVPAWRQEIARQ